MNKQHALNVLKEMHQNCLVFASNKGEHAKAGWLDDAAVLAYALSVIEKQVGTDTTPHFVALVRLVDDNKDVGNTRCGILAPDEVAAIEWCIAHL